MTAIWVRKSGSFDEDRRADREFWRAASADARLQAVEQLRQHWAKLNIRRGLGPSRARTVRNGNG